MLRNALVGTLTIALLGFGIGDLERGNRLYREGRYAEAVEAYRGALRDGKESPALHYNLGTALLRLGRHEEAERHFRAALGSTEPEMRGRTHYNLGGRHLEAGRAAGDPRVRKEHLDAAVEAYKQALRIDPADADAKWNLELALRERENPPPQPQGGGSSDDRDDQSEDQEGAQRGQGEGDPSPAQDSPSPGSARQEGQGPLTREQAERILGAAEQDERNLYRQKLRQGRRDTPVARDW